ncbi:MAG: Ig-like domain-containing protein [Clostridia bacterium]|nr:Ig-like domain-containing protein [Clostridia bacterium]
MKKTKFLTLVTLMLVLVCSMAAFALTACGSGVKISLSQTELNIKEGGKGNVVATIEGTEEAAAWEISDESIATYKVVGKVCTVTAVKEGKATLTASVGDAKATCTVNVAKNDTETVSVTLDGTEITELSLEMENEKTLVATASKGSQITWESSNEKIATVNNGLVKGIRPGEVTITAKVSASIKAEVKVTVTGDYEYYELTLKAGADDANKNPKKWTYWTEWCQFTTLEYDNGTLNLEFTENGGNWYNLQLFYNNTDLDGTKYYKLSCDIDSTAAGHATLNGNVINIQEGKHTYDVYFVGGLAFNMQFGVEGRENNINAATVSISNIKWAEDTERVTLQAPSFSLDTDTMVISITDSNNEGVSGYLLNFYQGSTKVTSVSVTDGGKVDVSKIANGEYTVKLQALALNNHYINSEDSATSVTVTVANEGGLSYDITEGGKDGNGVKAQATPGIWTYWTESWVVFSGNFADDKLSIDFSNNAGNWYDTQLFYKAPGLEAGKSYTLTLNIDTNAGGKVTLNGKEFTIEEGKKDYEIEITGDGLSLQFTFGLTDQNNKQEIQAAKMTFEIKSVTPKAE